jgi:hypothetical protein
MYVLVHVYLKPEAICHQEISCDASIRRYFRGDESNVTEVVSYINEICRIRILVIFFVLIM